MGKVNFLRLFLESKPERVKSYLVFNYSLFPILWSLSFFVGVLESFTYPGFAFRYMFLPFYLMFGLTILSGITLRLSIVLLKPKRHQYSQYLLLSSLNKILIIPIVVSYMLVNLLDIWNYHNYVFSLIHLQPELYLWPTFLSVFLFILDFQDKKINLLLEGCLKAAIKFKFKNFIGYILITMSLIFISMAILTNFIYVVLNSLKSIAFIVKNIDYTYDDKMRHVWGSYYDYMKFVNENTSENAKILIPPQESPWLSEGNVNLSRYFVYPRRLYNGQGNEIDIKDVDYVLIAWGSWQIEDQTKYGWPKEKLEAEEILLYDIHSKTVAKMNIDYDPNDDIFKNSWGIIKLKK